MSGCFLIIITWHESSTRFCLFNFTKLHLVKRVRPFHLITNLKSWHICVTLSSVSCSTIIQQHQCVIGSYSVSTSFKGTLQKASHRNKERCPPAHIWMQNLPSLFQHNKWWIFITQCEAQLFACFHVGTAHCHALTQLSTNLTSSDAQGRFSPKWAECFKKWLHASICCSYLE